MLSTDRPLLIRRPWQAGTGLLALGMVLTGTSAAWGHVGQWTPGQPWWRAWNWDPVILINLALFAWFYGRGVCRIWQRAGVGYGISRRQAGACGAGLLTLFVALISPIDVLSEHLSWVHMIQHMLLMMVAAPLLAVAAPAYVLMWGASLPWRHALRRWRRRLETRHGLPYLLWQPLLLWSLYAVTLWIWHLPLLYHAALRNPYVHDLQHLTFFAASCLYWRVLLDPLGRLRLSRGLAVLYLFTTSLHASVLGIFMTLSPRVWYRDYEPTTAAWNLTALEDQQLAGLIMWMPACLIYAIVAAAVFALWLKEFADAEE